jgi:hypothetical protein
LTRMTQMTQIFNILICVIRV